MINHARSIRNFALLPFFIALLALCPTRAGIAQSGGGHILFGDFKVDESQGDELKPITFQIILYTISGHIVSRQTISNNGRYRFMDVTNGEYDIVVEVENNEVARIRVLLAEPFKTDVRRDIALEWRSPSGARPAGQIGTIAAIDTYKRTAANESQFNKALAAIREEKYDEALSLLDRVLSADPKDFIAWTEVGTVKFKQGRFGEAEKPYQQALESNPSYIVALMNLGKLRMAEKRFDDAVEVFNRAIVAHPRSADANLFLGEAYLQIKKGSKAVGYLNEALRLDPLGKAEVHLRLAALYNGAGMKDRAVEEYERFLSKKPDYPGRKKLEQYISENKKR
ncbi:MAG: tetratricopeptide repeat protein [Blastocatellia bacterium]